MTRETLKPTEQESACSRVLAAYDQITNHNHIFDLAWIMYDAGRLLEEQANDHYNGWKPYDKTYVDYLTRITIEARCELMLRCETSL